MASPLVERPKPGQYELSHLRSLEAEAIHIIREVAAEFERPVLLFSGGKDSIVTLEAVRGTGRVPLLFSVGNAPAVVRTVQVAGLPHVSLTRALDPRLLELNRRGAINGHVPVTAVVSCLAVIAALVHGACFHRTCSPPVPDTIARSYRP